MRGTSSNLVDTIKENFLLVIIGSILLVFIGYFGWKYYNQEMVTITKYKLTERARINPFYASERLLNQQHPEKNLWQDQDFFAVSKLDMDLITLINQLPYLSKEDDNPTLVIRRLGVSINDQSSQDLKKWIEDGGHLITFGSETSQVDSNDWQMVEKRLNTLKKNVGLKDSTDSEKPINLELKEKLAINIANDEKLQSLLMDIKEDSNDPFLHSLGIYVLDNPNSKNDNFATFLAESGVDLSEIIDSEATSEQQTDDTQPEEVNTHKKEHKKSNNLDEDVENQLERLYHNQSKALIAIADDVFMVNGNSRKHLDSSLFYLQNTQVKKRQDISTANITQIRQYLTNQLLIIDEYIKHSDKLEKENIKLDFRYFTPKEQQQTLQALLKLPEAELLHTFAVDDKALIDSDYGKGRITVLSQPTVWKNPQEEEIESINLKQDYLENGTLPYDLLQNKFSQSNVSSPTKLGIFKPNSSLYSDNNVELLTVLTENSNKVWLFPNIDVDILPVMLWKQARLAVVGLALLTFIWLWSLYNRFGKQEYLDNSQSADIFRYFRKIGHYGWDYDNGKKLSKATRQQVLQLVKRSLNLAVKEPLTEQHMAKLSELLCQCLSDKLENSQKPEQLLVEIEQNQQYLYQLLSETEVNEVILATSDDLNRLNESGFTQYTQKLWLIKWLLMSKHKT